jgi:ubiquinone/menaquinone biosynthesis C-methylase UbiE
VRDLSDYPRPGIEVRLVERLVPLHGRRILEIGCGDGRLTRQLAKVASSVDAFDPDPERIAEARRLSADWTNVSFRVGSAEAARSRRARFDLALFSWSL